MVSLKTISLVLLATLSPVGGAAQPPNAPDVVVTFATCAGRLSALMQHQWLVADPSANETEAMRKAMIGLLEASTTKEIGRAVLSYRTAGRQAQAALLTRSAFNADDGDAAWAKARSTAEIAACTGLLLQ